MEESATPPSEPQGSKIEASQVLKDDDGLQIETIGGKTAGFTNATPESGAVLGRVGLRRVTECDLPCEKAREITSALGLPDLREIGDDTAAGRAIKKAFRTTTRTKPSWDGSADEFQAGDLAEYDYKRVRGGQFIIHRVIVRPTADGKPLRLPVNLARIIYHAEKYHIKKKERVVDAPPYLTIEQYNPEHPIVSQESLDKMLQIATQGFTYKQTHYIGQDVSEWMQAQVKAAQGADIKPGVTFFLEEFHDQVAKLQKAMEQFNKFTLSKSRFGMGLKLYTVFDVEAERDYLAERVEEQVMSGLKSVLQDTVKLLTKVDDDTKATDEVKVERRMKVMAKLDETLDKSEEFRNKYATLLQRRIDITALVKPTAPSADPTAPPPGQTNRFSLIAEVLKKKQIIGDVSAILNYTPSTDDLVIDQVEEGA